jgi:hypothetical protein
MRLLIGLFLILLGGGVMLGAVVMALLELGSLYQGALEDPLGQPMGAEQSVQTDMLRWAALGALGAAPFLIGMFLYKGAAARRRRRR